SLGHAYFHFLAAAIERVAKRTASEGLSCSATKYCALVLLVTLVINSSQFRTPCPTSAQPSSSRHSPAGAISLTCTAVMRSPYLSNQAIGSALPRTIQATSASHSILGAVSSRISIGVRPEV